MRIRNVLHKGLGRFIEKDDPSGLQPSVVEKLRRILSFPEAMEHEEELKSVPRGTRISSRATFAELGACRSRATGV